MTHRKIEKYRQRLVDIVKKETDSEKRNKAFIGLAREVGASNYPGGMLLEIAERDADHIRSIHQALQTATMIDMCKTANRNFVIALVVAIAAVLSALAALILAFK